jgi:superfamily II DNA/RNA helicase
LKFEELNIAQSLKDGIDSFNYQELTPIQEKTLPIILKNKDLLACSQTGSGKTAAFLIPIMDKILYSERDGIKALVIAPTREICIQIEEQIAGLGYFAGISSLAVYGGSNQENFTKQRNALENKTDIIVATPGRFLAHLKLGYVNLNKLLSLVLDEADEMLDMGFYADIMSIISYLPKKRQNLLFSATMPNSIKKLADEILVNPEFIDLNFSLPAEEIEQKVFMVFEKDKAKLLNTVLNNFKNNKILIFAGTKLSVSRISSYLRTCKIKHSSINSNFTQEERIETVQNFKSGNFNILVTTNLLSRGIDIEDVNLIINYDIPEKAEDYVHRIGRTARAGKLGMAISFINENEISNFNRIEKLLKREIAKSKLPEGFSSAPEYKVIVQPRKRRWKTNRKTIKLDKRQKSK